MKYSELIEVNKGFQASVNLEYDLNKISKVRSYIPTEQSVKVLGAFLRSYYYSSEPQGRATVLIGPYGRGKSHLLLVLSALTSLDLRASNDNERATARKIQYELCDKIAAVDKEVGALAKAIVDSEIRTLPVIINSNSADINQSFLIAINEALRNAELQRLLPNTYFDSAIAIIEKWEESFPEAYKKLASELKNSKTTVDELRIALKRFDEKAYSLFCDCYPRIAAGTEFNPLTNMDVVKLYLAVVNALCEQTAYKGITIIFDEFSKFLEANLDKSKMLNFKIIQDMAEAATRSGSSQLHFTCITHKDILDYSSSDSFKTVEGRFRKLRFVASSEQSYELIANAIIKREKFEQFKRSHKSEFDFVASASAITNVFSDLTEEAYQQKLVYGCFPLTPLSAFSLLHVSELVGQNERTLFTFLAQDDQHTLRSFLANEVDGFATITVDCIYDYFEELFKKEVFNASVHSVWAKTDSALRQISNEIQRKVLKAIAIINIIGDERLKPTPAHIKSSLMLNDDTFETATKALLKLHILSQRDSSEYVLLTANGVDVQKTVDSFVKTQLPRISECSVLERACELGYVLPREYNDKYGMTRCFKSIYMDAAVFVQYKNAHQLLSQYPYDGLIVHVICLKEELREKALKKIQSFAGTPQIVLCMTRFQFEHDLLLKQYEAVGQLLAKNVTNGDPHFVEELEVYGEDLQKRIQNAVYSMYSPTSEHSVFVNCDGVLPVSRQVELNKAISKICNGCYDMTPVVNNEMVNKRILNTQNTKARDLVVNWILQHAEDTSIPCMDGYGPEVSIFKSAFKHTGLDVSFTVDDPGMNAVLKKISEFIAECETSKKNFANLYQTLCSAPFGMRKGIIPLYIAYVLRQYKESIVLYYSGKEIELSAAALSHLNESPENYQILIETGIGDRNKYLDGLQLLFEQHADKRTPSINRIYSIVKSMQNWMRSLPEYTKKHRKYLENGELKNVDSTVELIRSELMRFEINSRELLFETWISKLSKNDDLSECLAEVTRVKTILDEHLANYRNELTKKLTAMFMPGYQGGLTHAVASWYKKLPDTTKQHVFDANANALLSTASALNAFDDGALLDDLVAIFVSIAIEDWNDASADSFIKSVSDTISRINEYVETKSDSEQDGRLTIAMDGVVVEKSFAADAITPLGKTAFNNLKSVFEEYNDALEPDEQLAILARLIGEIIH